MSNTKSLGGPSTPRTCTATNLGVPGSFDRIFQYGTCHNRPLYAWTKGANGHTWAEEHFFFEDGFIKLNQDTGPYNGIPFAKADVLRDGATGRKGIRVLQGWFCGPTVLNHGTYYVERWRGSQKCSYQFQGSDPSSGYEENRYLGTISNWLYDCRTGRPCTSGTKYPIQVIERKGHFGTATDTFWFARWQDPMNGNQSTGLGIVKFTCRGWSMCPADDEKHYLVDCNSAYTCFTCPDP